MEKAFYSKYIINGVQQELVPARILGLPEKGMPDNVCLVDETLDPEIGAVSFHSSQLEQYLSKVLSMQRTFPLAFPGEYTRLRIESALLDSLWREGHFNIGDLALSFDWKFSETTGSVAAFYRSVEAAADCLDGLGLDIAGCICTGAPSLDFSASVRLSAVGSYSDEASLRPFCSENPTMGQASKVGRELLRDLRSWIIYVPFDTCEYRLGGSLLSQSAKGADGVAPTIDDSDYFLDCYEVLREMVEDGVVMSAATVSDGGLMTALKKMTSGGTGAVIDVGDLMRAVSQDDIVRVLFSEVPGAVIQVSNQDFDYIDAEFLLQDVAFYPVGHPSESGSALSVRSTAGTAIQKILASLVQNQCGEGED